MLVVLSGWLLFAFGLFLLGCGLFMLFWPAHARKAIARFGSTGLINYSELGIRLAIGLALLVYADHSRWPTGFTWLGWFMTVTAVLLLLLPRKMHHAFSSGSADRLRPLYIRLLSPLAFLFGAWVLYQLHWW